MKKLIFGLLFFATIAFAKFHTGDTVIVHFGSQNQYECEAVIIIPGSTKSKVEYTKYCSLRFLDERNAGQQEWVPNTAIW